MCFDGDESERFDDGARCYVWCVEKRGGGGAR